MIKAIISDIDGTLLNKNLEYSPRLSAAIKAAEARGVIFTLATGRMYVSAKNAVRGLDIKVPIICYNGAYIREFNGPDILYQQSLESEAANKILTACQTNDWHAQYYINEELYCAVDSERIRKYAQLTGVQHHVLGEDFYAPQEPISKILLIDEQRDLSVICQILKNTGANVDFTSSKPSFLEIIPKGVSKGAAIKKLAAHLNISTEDIMAVGDSYNDMEMLKSVGHGVAMGNAEPALKAIARYVTDDHNADGLAKAIEKYVLGS